MSLLNIATYLQTGGFGTKGTSIFIDDVQADLSPAIVLKDAGGPYEAELNGELKRLEFQAIFRAADYASAQSKAKDVTSYLNIRQKQIGDAWFYTCYAQHEPIPFGSDSSGIYTFVVNFEATWRN